MAKKVRSCVACHCELPKDQAEFISEETFAFLKELPKGVVAGFYCNVCFESHVRAELDSYNHKMELAKNINVFYLSQSKECRYIRRIAKPIEVSDVHDQDEALLRLAFLAVEAGKNTIVDVEFKSTKIKNGRWQTSRWAARGIPGHSTEYDLSRRVVNNPN